MKIQNISPKVNVNQNFTANTTRTSKVLAEAAKYMNQKDSFRPENYNRENFVNELSSYKNQHGKPRFKEQDIQTLVRVVEYNPKKYDPIRNIASNIYVKGADLAEIAMSSPDVLNVVREFSGIRKQNGKPKYNGEYLKTFSKATAEVLNDAKPLTATNLTPKRILEIAQDEKLNVEGVRKKVLEMEKLCGVKKIGDVTFRKDIYDPNKTYFLTGVKESGEKRTVLMDKKLSSLAIEETSEYTSQSGKDYLIVKTNDFRNKTTSKVRYCYDDSGYPCVESQVRIKKDKDGKVLYTEYMGPSDVKGIYDAKIVYPDGRIEETSSGKIDSKTGITTVKHDMKSLDGTRTQYLYENDPEGNRIIDYKITDEKGNVLLNYSQSLEMINENEFISSKNGKSYKITVDNDNKLINVKDQQTEKENKISMNKFLKGDKKAMLNLLKKFPGEELIALKDTTDKLNGVKTMDDCCYHPGDRQIDTVDDLYSVLHELGHAKDYNGANEVLTGRKDVQAVYNKEKSLFNKEFPKAQREHIDYFIDVIDHYSGKLGGLEETVAESNALLNSYNEEANIAARSFYLQQYFPKTIAKLAQLLHK